MTDTNKLKELAERATPGPWVVDAQQSGAILALLDEIDRLKAENEALRMAVKRGLVVTPDRENQRTLVSNQAGHEYCAIYWDKLGEMAATRLAITEAAAEIGKSMGGGE